MIQREHWSQRSIKSKLSGEQIAKPAYKTGRFLFLTESFNSVDVLEKDQYHEHI